VICSSILTNITTSVEYWLACSSRV